MNFKENIQKLPLEASLDGKENGRCIVIMPRGELDNYKPGHFLCVYEDIIKPACELTGFSPFLIEEIKPATSINLDVLQNTLNAPLAVCDLSTGSPIVYFLVAYRLAFNKPTVLVQELYTPKLFDVSVLTYIEYRGELKYREVLEDQKKLAEGLRSELAVHDKNENVGALNKILSITGGSQTAGEGEMDPNKLLQLMHYQMSSMHSEIQNALHLIPAGNEREDAFKPPADFNSVDNREPTQQAEDCYFMARKLYAAGASKRELAHILELARNKLIGTLQSDASESEIDKVHNLLNKITEFEKHLLA